MQGRVRPTASTRLAMLSMLLTAAAGVCSAQIFGFDSTPYAAKVMSLTGRVSVIRDSNPDPWALQVGDHVQAKELIITGPDGQASFEVSDGSTFIVYPNSRVVFRKNEPNWRDLLDVLVGRVKVQIEHLYGPNPNRVLTPTAVISVRGTTFDITVDEEDETTLVEVEEGVVDVRHAMLGGNSKTLTTGETLRVYRDVPIAKNRFDKGPVFEQAFRMVVNAISTWESRIPRGSVGPGGCGGCGDDDHGKGPPPPPQAPPPPPAAPPPSVTPHFVEAGGHMIILYPDHPDHETRWHKFGRVFVTTARRVLLGQAPGQDVLVEYR
jgi:hypothetical protein